MHVIIVLKMSIVLLISTSKLEWVGSCAMLSQLGFLGRHALNTKPQLFNQI
jgi:hypothetical protein